MGMKLLHVVSTMNPASGGIVSALSSLNEELERAGHETKTVCLDPPDAAWLANRQEPIAALGQGRTSYQYHSGLKKFLREQPADAIVAHGLWQYIGFATREAAKQSGRPYLIFPHGMLDPWFKRTYPLKHLKKWLYWPWGEYRVLRDAARVLFTCEEERRLARESFPQLYRAREAVVGLGLRDEARDREGMRENFWKTHPELRDKKVFLFLGRLHPKKGLEMLIPAFGKIVARHPDVRLQIAGTVSGSGVGPDYLDGLKRLAVQSCPPQTVDFGGLLTGADKWAALHAAEALVLPSHQENFGMAVIEALSCSTPVLLSDKVNIWREIESGGAGLIEADTPEGTERLLERWLTLPEMERERGKKKARACFENHFESGRVANVLTRVIQDTLVASA